MKWVENERLECKREVVEGIKKEVIAFANTLGGKIIIGVDDLGEEVGIDNIAETLERIQNMVRDSIRPDITMFITYEIASRDGKNLIEMDVESGTEKPYYLKSKGIRPEGVYVRQGASSVPASISFIKKLIKESGEPYEKSKALHQNLTFRAAEYEFELRKVPFGVSEKQTLGISNSEGVYTNLGYLLSDQCSHSIKVALFKGIDQMEFQNRDEFTGSLFVQLDKAYQYLDMANNTRATFDGLYRIDKIDYPEVALREALLNMVVHRDYSRSTSSIISIYDDRVEFISIGGLHPNLDIEDIRSGISHCRNEALANVFYRLKLIEAYGTGITKMDQAYADFSKKPVYQITPNVFKTILPNMNYMTSRDKSDYEQYLDYLDLERMGNVKELSSVYGAEHRTKRDSKVLESNEMRILLMLRRKGSVTRQEVAADLEVSDSTAGRFLRALHNEGILLKKGAGPTTRYILNPR